ncbi:MAG: hypothetical protein J1E78_03870 [Muribaculaceae bacterium]|nr:hypothetical protein [Muribaculaceae bacterium]
MKKIAFIVVLSCFTVGTLTAQTNKASNQQKKESFEEFRNRIKNNYNEFRQTILDHYADFLNGEWHEYESLNGLKRDETPKPEVAPRVELPPVNTQPVITEPEKTEPTKEIPEEIRDKSPELANQEPQTEPAQPEQVKPEPVKPAPAPLKPEPVKPEPEKQKPVLTEPEKQQLPSLAENKPSTPSVPAPAAPSKPNKSDKSKSFDFTFYEIPMEIVDIDFSIANKLANPSDFSNQWKNLETQKVAAKLLPSIKKEIKEIGLNDYLTYKYLESYVNSKFPGVDNSSKMALVHYLLVNLGYDARIAVTSKGTPLLLIPFKQTVYGKSYLSLSNMKYYIFPPEGYEVASIFKEKVMTCQLPSDVDKGNTFDLVLGELNIPVKPKAFDLEYGPVHLTGEMNENLIPILYRYPQMPIEDYAKSNLQPALRQKLTDQIKEQLDDLDGDKGVEALLHFTQNAFEYATDDNYHGFEKPYFIEETLFYPKNDCEDRAIFYTYFLYNALGREAQLVSFPGHEAATVALKEPKGGVSYNQDGKTFYISDPTYIGASSGMVMPSYMNVKPDVDYTYTKH